MKLGVWLVAVALYALAIFAMDPYDVPPVRILALVATSGAVAIVPGLDFSRWDKR